MAQNDVMQIKLNNLPVGIMGLKAVMEEMAITNADSPDEVVRDLKEIGKYGVMGTRALIINRKVKSVGRVPTRSQLTAWLKEAKGYS